MLDPISDMLTRIRNASLAGHSEVLVPFSGFKNKMAELLKKEGFVANTEIIEEEETKRKQLRIMLRYMKNEKGASLPYIQGLKRVSRQGQRIYAGKEAIPFGRGKYGFSIISTSKGLMTNDEARKIGIGGEVICEIW
jgi:small subunit ribosomal protein S8